MKIVLMILLLIASIVLIASILFQSGNSAGLSGSIGGGAEQLFGKKRAAVTKQFSARLRQWVRSSFSSAPLFLRQLNNLYRRAEIYFCPFFLIVSHIRAKSFAFRFYRTSAGIRDERHVPVGKMRRDFALIRKKFFL